MTDAVIRTPAPTPALPTTPSLAVDDVRRGVMWMLGASLMFVSLDATAKHLSATNPTEMVVWGRYVFHLLLLTLWLGRGLPVTLKTDRLALQVARSAALLTTTWLFFGALATMALANVTALMFVAPLMVTALSIPILGERVGARRWAGVACGFLGAMIIVRPTGGAPEIGALLALGAAGTYAFYVIATRMLAPTDRAMTTSFYGSVVGALAMSLAAPLFWVTPSLVDLATMAVLGFFGFAGHFALIRAFSYATASTLTPLGYLNLVWATALGFALFGDFPDVWTILGAAVIVGSSWYVFHREQQARAAAKG